MRDEPERPWRAAVGGAGRQGAACVIVRFRLTPKSSKDSIDGLDITAEGPAFKVRVCAVPEDGAANAALERLAAAWLQVPKSAVSLISGAKSRVKTLAIGGDPAILDKKLQAKFTEISKNTFNT